MIIRIVMLFILILNFALSSDGIARRPESGTVEFAILGGVNILSGNGESETYLIIPGGSGSFPMASMMRASIWTGSHLVYDFGFSLMHISDGGDLNIFNIEGGLSSVWEEENANVYPYAGILLGVLSIANGNPETESYIGFHGGIRQFFRDNAAIRMQLAYRRFPGRKFNLESSLEVTLGLSLFVN